MHNLYADFLYGSQSFRETTGSTDGELDRAEAGEIGSRHPERCWILTDRDVWHLNPYFKGEVERHPEDCPDEDEEARIEEQSHHVLASLEANHEDFWNDIPEDALYRC